MIDPADPTRQARWGPWQPTHVDTSLDRLVLSIAADPVHLVVIAGTVQPRSAPRAPARRWRAAEAAALLAGWVAAR